MRILYAIPSRARHTEQPTVRALELAGVEHYLIFVDKADKRTYDDIHYPKVHACPSTVTGIGEVRQHIIVSAINKGFSHVIMLDDDLTFAKRRLDEPDKFENMKPKDYARMFSRLEKLFAGFNHIGMCSREGGNRLEPGYVENTRMLRILGYDLNAYSKSGAQYDRMELMEDFDVTLTMLRAGYPNAVLTDYCHNQKSSNAPGGCSTYRTLEKQAAAAHKLAKLHPGFVKTVEKTTKTAWNGATRTDVRIAWKKAYESSQK